MKIEQLMEKVFNVLDKAEELEGFSFYAETDGTDQVTSVSINFESCKLEKYKKKVLPTIETVLDDISISTPIKPYSDTNKLLPIEEIPTKITTSDKVSDLKTEYAPYYETGSNCSTGTKVTYTPDLDCKTYAVGSAITTTASTDDEVIVIDGSTLSKPSDAAFVTGMSCTPVEGDE